MLLKLESGNPTGSIKDRTAAGLLMALDAERPLRPGTVVVESTSGNLGLGLARLLHHLDCRFVAVIDPNTPRATRQTLVAAGANCTRSPSPTAAAATCSPACARSAGSSAATPATGGPTSTTTPPTRGSTVTRPARR
nr:hypothetical protein GCM10020093_034540 [Planobispora longispora]